MSEELDTATESPAEPTTIQKILAEVLGTFVLVFLGCGSVVLFRAAPTDLSSSFDLIGVANIVSVGLSFGLAVLIMAYAVGRISGGHFNPAVTLGAAVGGRLPWKDVPLYMVAQFAGATLGALFLFGIGKGYDGWDAEPGTMGANAWGDEGSGISWWSAGLLELVLTFIFLMVILAVTDARNEHPNLAPLAIGLSLAAIHFVAIPATGTSVNPARSFGPALFSGTDTIVQLWVFFLFPLAGGALAGVLYPLLFGENSALGKPRAPKGVPSDAYQAEWNQQQWAGAPAGQQQWGAQQGQQAWPQQPAAPAAPQQQWPQQGQSGEQAWPQQQAAPQQPQAPQAPQAAPSGEQQGWPQGQGQGWQGQQQWPQQEGGDDDGRTQIRPQG